MSGTLTLKVVQLLGAGQSTPKILESDKFIIQSRGYPDEYIDVFYVASMEFMDYISTNYGGIKNILYRVSNGEQFSIAFEEETGKTYTDMYKEWHERFF